MGKTGQEVLETLISVGRRASVEAEVKSLVLKLDQLTQRHAVGLGQ